MDKQAKKQAQGTIQAASDKLRDILKAHAEGKPILREIAARIAARAERSRLDR